MTSAGAAPPAPIPSARRGPHPLDAIAVALAVIGAGCVASGLLPGPDAASTLGRILPLLLFLGTVVILAELTAAAGVFDVLATRLAVAAGGSWPALFALSVGFAAVTTIVLNLDTTAVLLTPVMLTLAVTLRIAVAPLAVTTVWLANTASLLLPVSNLTNLLAADRIGLDPLGYASLMWLPQLAVLAVTTMLLWCCWWRPDQPPGNRFPAPAPHRPADPVLYRTALAGCLLFVGAILAGAPVGLGSAVAAGLLVLGFAFRSPATLRPALVPWRLLLFVTGLFLVVQTIGRHGLNDLVAGLVGQDGGVLGALRAGGTGALLANLVNNLPAYLAGEAVLAAGERQRLLALLIGTNVGPLALPWASLATLLWLERCRAARVRVPVARFLVTSAALAVLGTLAAVGALLLTG
ncbi:SLC13 family permease [Micromonospora sp. NPDC049891]|uniref:SLC13 family permease n=1 Tax=Micromonospora sp. NPDC049891 TaxID=3155655 RepID=UPI0033F76784